jgi:hypothetical protein
MCAVSSYRFWISAHNCDSLWILWNKVRLVSGFDIFLFLLIIINKYGLLEVQYEAIHALDFWRDAQKCIYRYPIAAK